MQGKFSHTRYDFPSLIEVSKKLVLQAVVRCGGRIEKDTVGRDVMVIPVRDVVPSKLIQTFKPGAIAGSHYSREEMSRIKAKGK